MPLDPKTMNVSDRPSEFDPKAPDSVKIGVLRDNFDSLWSKLEILRKKKCCVQTTDDLPEGLQNLYYSDELVEVLLNSLNIIGSSHTHATIAPLNYDDYRITRGSGHLSLDISSIAFYLNSVLLDTLTMTYNSDNKINTVTNVAGDVWTATYDTYGGFSTWIKT